MLYQLLYRVLVSFETGDEISEEQLTNYSRFEIDKDSPRHVFAGASLTEERIERVITASDCLITWHLSIRLYAVLQTVQLPTGIAHLDTGLADMDRDTLTLKR